ncbi:winged helix-turn-helix transcriptional regulator [Aureibacter tunicatorum]|uniref:DNA-binding HxlR family transcriptional regulator n=1 Tax=Aureibacter tunicatorum TaxID=866807 RepID=A0AAE3XRV9_9BACT|nr:helix-turn-helix domain-containing protein [Aureibacter tunicatorum]MDR6240766.1 DNA-binding HxlR family transcriptional regulator [Aureibacter tunicatorum]BDD06901.1 transcriptional regulator [Aureibacter tunicatorum]
MNKKILEKFGDSENCPIRNILDRIGDKWSMLVLLLLNEEKVLRFNEMHKYIGTISQKMLSVTLKSLESDGLVQRTVYPQVPPKVEYQLTERGLSLIPHLQKIAEWAKQNFSAITKSRDEFAKVS